jgi:NAD(P)H-flavin reductase/hemoglobin-like flavoprotein
MQVFFAQLFAGHPEIRAMFPLGMAQTRAAVFEGLARLIWILDCPREFEASLRRIAATHRKYGVHDEHVPLFFAALVKTVELVSGRNWSAESARSWHGLASRMTEVMLADSALAAGAPSWWVGEIVRHDRRSATVAVLTIKPDQPLEFRAGQFLAVQVPQWPRVWRSYSIANAPRDSGLIDLHIRAVPGGVVSNALVSQAAPGDALILGQPAGTMLVPADPDRQVACVAAGTGLAPVKAIIEEIASDPWQRRRQIALYLGARDERDFYDMPDLLALRSAYPSLTIIPAYGPGQGAGRGPLLDALRAHHGLQNAEIYLSGPAGLVSDLVRMLDGRVKASAVHHDPIDQLAAASGSGPARGLRR